MEYTCDDVRADLIEFFLENRFVNGKRALNFGLLDKP